MAEHLGIRRDVLEDAIVASDGRLAGAIDALRKDKGRSLRPFDPPNLNSVEELVANSELLNSDRPESFSEGFARKLETLPSPGKAGCLAVENSCGTASGGGHSAVTSALQTRDKARFCPVPPRRRLAEAERPCAPHPRTRRRTDP